MKIDSRELLKAINKLKILHVLCLLECDVYISGTY